MDQSQARFAAICSCLMFLFAVGTAFCWWRVLVIDHERIGAVPPTLGELIPVTLHESEQESHKTITPTTTRATAGKQESNTSTIGSAANTVNLLPVVKELPKQLTLKVPFTSQAPEKNWDEPWQDACEEAAALMLDAYYKKYTLSPLFAKDELLGIIEWEKTKGWGYSIEIEKVQLILSDYLHLAPTKKIRIVENPTVEKIKQFIANGEPVLAVADGKVLPNPHFHNGGPEYHALIIKGYTETEFVTNDPGTQFGEDFIYQQTDIMNALHDWNNGGVKQGRRVVLVIE